MSACVARLRDGAVVDAARRRAARLAACTLALCVATGCAATRGTEAAGPSMTGPWDMIAFEVRSWGRPVTSWRLLRSGSGSWTEIVEGRGAGAPRTVAVWHEVEAGEHGFDRVAAELARLPVPAPDSAVCTDRISDLPYGTLRLTRGATTVEIAWNSGCMDADYRAFVAILKAADSIVAGWGRAGRTLRTEPLR
jgi:hypothetical protein